MDQEHIVEFLKNLQAENPDQYVVTDTVIKTILDTHPDISLNIKYGGVIFLYKEKSLGGIFPYKDHSSLEFSNGVLLDDPKRILQGNGKRRRHLKFKIKDNIDTNYIKNFIHQLILDI